MFSLKLLPALGLLAALAGCATAPEHLSADYGQALKQDIAAQIADPRDLYSPAPPTPADTARKSAVLERYRKGEKTGADTDDNAKGTVSQAIQ